MSTALREAKGRRGEDKQHLEMEGQGQRLLQRGQGAAARYSVCACVWVGADRLGAGGAGDEILRPWGRILKPPQKIEL